MSHIKVVRESYCKDCGEMVSSTETTLLSAAFQRGLAKNPTMYSVIDGVAHIRVDSATACEDCRLEAFA